MKSILIITTIAVTLIACSQEKQGDEHAGHTEAKEESSATKYTCPMHPNVVQDGPGKCPVCGMDLVPKTANTTASTDDLMLSDSQIKLANITTQKVSMQSIGQTVLVNGKLVANEDLSKVISTRAAGRVEKAR